MSKSPSVVVVGGGVAGLATAYLLREIGRERKQEANITLLEANSEPGGSTRTEHQGGFLCEWGPNGFLDNEPATFDLVKRLNLTDRLVKADEQSSKRFIFHHGKMREVPLKPPAFIVSDILPLPAKLRMAMEFFIPAKRNGAEETVYEFGERRLGAAFAKYMLDPMVSGIFAGDARQLSLPAVFPKMVEMENDYGGLFKALIAKKKEAKRDGTPASGPAGPGATLHTFRNGMGELTATLAAKLSASVHTESPVKAVIRKANGFTVQTNGAAIETDAVVLASPSFATADIIADMTRDTASAIRDIWHAPVDVVCHGHRIENVEHPLNGFGVLVPRSEGVRSLGCLWCNSIFPGQAPDGQHLLRTIIGGAHDPDVMNLSDEEIEHIARIDNGRLFGANQQPIF